MKTIPKNFKGVTIGQLIEALSKYSPDTIIATSALEEVGYSEHTSDIHHIAVFLEEINQTSIRLCKDNNGREFLLIDPDHYGIIIRTFREYELS